MKVLYVANHDSGGNDDEGAITYALEKLGHTVIKCPEQPARQKYTWPKVDFCLFHKWDCPEALRQIECPKVFWYFDLVDYPKDQTLNARCRQRVKWMQRIIPEVQLGFCTDGDWVNQLSDHKIRWLPQGADERIVGKGSLASTSDSSKLDILFTGISKGGGTEREQFVQDTIERYTGRFVHIQRGVYRDTLKEYIARAKIVLCPSSPITDRYWSNRVFNALGFCGFVLHPYCYYLQPTRQEEQELTGEWFAGYRANRDLVYYHSQKDLYQQIEYYLHKPTIRETISQAGYEHTISHHLYRHRIERLLEVVKSL